MVEVGGNSAIRQKTPVLAPRSRVLLLLVWKTVSCLADAIVTPREQRNATRSAGGVGCRCVWDGTREGQDNVFALRCVVLCNLRPR